MLHLDMLGVFALDTSYSKFIIDFIDFAILRLAYSLCSLLAETDNFSSSGCLGDNRLVCFFAANIANSVDNPVDYFVAYSLAHPNDSYHSPFSHLPKTRLDTLH
jgi:hypothetical protein